MDAGPKGNEHKQAGRQARSSLMRMWLWSPAPLGCILCADVGFCASHDAPLRNPTALPWLSDVLPPPSWAHSRSCFSSSSAASPSIIAAASSVVGLCTTPDEQLSQLCQLRTICDRGITLCGRASKDGSAGSES
jgi:hypothetical protein